MAAPPDADLRVWATRLFGFQFADQANDPALRAEVVLYAPACATIATRCSPRLSPPRSIRPLPQPGPAATHALTPPSSAGTSGSAGHLTKQGIFADRLVVTYDT